jgi:hypothetical protein
MMVSYVIYLIYKEDPAAVLCLQVIINNVFVFLELHKARKDTVGHNGMVTEANREAISHQNDIEDSKGKCVRRSST